MSTHRIMGPLLWEALDVKRKSLRMTWRDVSRTLNLAPSAFVRLRDPKNGVSAHALVTMLEWLERSHRGFTVRVETPGTTDNKTGQSPTDPVT